MGKTHKIAYHHLKNKWVSKHRDLQNKLWEKHGESLSWLSSNVKQLAAGSAAGMLLLTAPNLSDLPTPQLQLPAGEVHAEPLNKGVFLIADLARALPHQVQPLTIEEEDKVAEILSRNFGVKVAAELDGKRLNRSYGLIGAEQHLMRYPGDTISSHFETPEEAAVYARSGMAPGRGAWGYFAQDGSMTKQDIEREKYYLAVQTFLSPGWGQNSRELYNFFKFRKMLIVNPQNGKAMVVVIGDAGPAVWTGKHLGGSPEVMKYLERVDGRQRGPVLYYFIDDPENKIPLGPIEVQ